MLKEKLDKRICDCETGAGNTQTYREFIIESEKEFEIGHSNLDLMSEEKLQSYLDFLNELWSK